MPNQDYDYYRNNPGAVDALRTGGGLSGTQGGGTNYSGVPNSGATPSTPSETGGGLSDLFTNQRDLQRRSLEFATAEAKRAAAQREKDLTAQMAEQRQNLSKSRNQLAKDSFMRGRNLLSGLAGRGLATTGLLQLGNVQNTVAKGQQLNQLHQGFNKAQESSLEGLNQNKQGLAARLSGLNLDFEGKQSQAAFQERDMNVRNAEMLLAYNNEEAMKLAGTTDPTVKAAISAEYDQLRTALGAQPSGAGVAADPQGRTTAQIISDSISDETKFGTVDDPLSIEAEKAIDPYLTGSGREQRATSSNWVVENPLFNSGNAATTALKADGGVPQNIKKIGQTGAGKAGYNDTYRVTTSNGSMELKGAQIAAGVMAGTIKLSDAQIRDIVSNFAGVPINASQVMGKQYDSIVKPFNQWLLENEYVRRSPTGGGLKWNK